MIARLFGADEGSSRRVEGLLEAYRGARGAAPSRAQWRSLLTLPADQPVTLLNFFKFRSHARYPADAETTGLSGQDAFGRYAAVSAPALEAVGGRFVLLAPFGGSLVGEDEDWDLIAAGSYPGPDAVFALFEGEAYRDAYRHRVAACERQKVLVCKA